MSGDWEPGIGSAQIKADSDAQDRRSRLMGKSVARIACGCTFTAIEPRPVAGQSEEDATGRPPEWIEREIVEPCVMHEDYCARVALIDRLLGVPGAVVVDEGSEGKTMTTPNEPTPLTALTGTTTQLLLDWPDGATYVFSRDQLSTVIEAAKMEERQLAATPPAGADLRAALDVERLARAFVAHWFSDRPLIGLDADPHDPETFRPDAEIIAREYAALATQPAERGEG